MYKSTQEIFDTVVMHLHRQGVKSVGAGRCRYLASGGLKCAVGCLIPDELYRPIMDEGLDLAEVVDLANILDGGDPNFESKLNILRRLQECHDEGQPAYWEIGLAEIANKYKLIFNNPWGKNV